MYIAKIAYTSNLYNIVKDCAMSGLEGILIKNHVPEPFLNYMGNPLALYSLERNKLNDLSVIEIQNVAETLYILSSTGIKDIANKA